MIHLLEFNKYDIIFKVFINVMDALTTAIKALQPAYFMHSSLMVYIRYFLLDMRLKYVYLGVFIFKII